VGGHALVSQGGKEAGQLTAVRQPQLGVEFQQRLEHEAPARNLRVRKREALGSVVEVAEEKNVYVDRPWRVANALGRPAELTLYLLAGIEQALGIE
jgi:hypothetical protein